MTGTTTAVEGRQRWTLVAAAAVIVVVVGLVAVFGLIPDPALPALADQPDPPVTARLAALRYGEDGPCLVVVEPDGVPREVRCGSAVEGFELRWADDDHVVLRRGPADQRVLVEVATGDVATAAEAPAVDQPDPTTHPTAGRLVTSAEDGRTWLDVLVDGDERRLLELDGPARYALVEPRWSADGRWVVVRDTASRVIVVDAAGEAPARVWLDDDGDRGYGELAVR